MTGCPLASTSAARITGCVVRAPIRNAFFENCMEDVIFANITAALRLFEAVKPTGWLRVRRAGLDDTSPAMRFWPAERVGK